MKLVKTIPHLGGLPEMLVFYCSRCKQAETKEQTVCRRPIGVVVGNERKAPTFWEVQPGGGTIASLSPSALNKSPLSH
jgi:hypothetical protein